jgi:hypothetical protein
MTYTTTPIGGESVIARAGRRLIQLRRQRVDGWTTTKRTRFLAMLAETCNVSRALKAVKMTASCLYRLRKRDPDFAAEWDAALEHGYALLEAELLDRAMHGRVRDVAKPGGTVIKVREVSDSLGLRLLAIHEKRVMAIRVARAAARREETSQVKRLARMMEEAIDRDVAEAEAAAAARMAGPPGWDSATQY